MPPIATQLAEHLRPAAGLSLNTAKLSAVGDFAAAMKPFMAADVPGAHGRHVQPATMPSMPPIGKIDSIPGANTRGVRSGLDPLAAIDHVPGTRGKHERTPPPSTLANDPAFKEVPPEKLAYMEQQARKWVAGTFFGTMLKQMHESPFKSELFSGGRGGKAFEPLMDQHLADHMAQATGLKLVRGIVRQLAGNAYRKQEPKGKNTAPADPYSGLNAGGSTGKPTGPSPGRAAGVEGATGGEEPSLLFKVSHVAPGLRG